MRTEPWLKRGCGRFFVQATQRRFLSSQSAAGAARSLLTLSQVECACAREKATACVYDARACFLPTTITTHTENKVQNHERFLSSHSPPLAVPTHVKSLAAPAGSSERWWSRGGRMLRGGTGAAGATGSEVRVNWRWCSLCRTCWCWPACWAYSTFTWSFQRWWVRDDETNIWLLSSRSFQTVLSVHIITLQINSSAVNVDSIIPSLFPCFYVFVICSAFEQLLHTLCNSRHFYMKTFSLIRRWVLWLYFFILL